MYNLLAKIPSGRFHWYKELQNVDILIIESLLTIARLVKFFGDYHDKSIKYIVEFLMWPRSQK